MSVSYMVFGTRIKCANQCNLGDVSVKIAADVREVPLRWRGATSSYRMCARPNQTNLEADLSLAALCKR